MDTQQISELLGAAKPAHITPSSPGAAALKSVGISTSPDGKSLIAAQERLLTAMEETQKAAGHSGALLRAGDLGEAAARLSGELPPSELRKILADTTDGRWRFAQDTNGTLKAVEGGTLNSIAGGPSMSRADIANRVASTYEQKIGMDVLEGTLSEAKSVALSQAGYGEKYTKAAWEAGESGAVSGAAEEAVAAAKAGGNLVSEEKMIAEAAAETAAKAGAKGLGKSLAKSVPLIGAGVVVSDIASAATDTYDSLKHGNFHDAGIDASRTVSKALFGVAGQIAAPTVVGGIAFNAAGEGVDIALQRQKTGNTEASIQQNDPHEILAKTFKNAIHDPGAAQDKTQNAILQQHPELQKAITAYSLFKAELGKDGNLEQSDHQVLAHIEKRMYTLIREDRLDEIKLPQIIETRTTTQSLSYELTPG